MRDGGVALDKILACPRCQGTLTRDADSLECLGATCDFRATVSGGIVHTLPAGSGPSFFDTRFPVMMHGSDEPRSHRTFYAQQVAALRERLKRARVVLDVGCGPQLAYERPPQSLVIGVDLSCESLRHNADVDVRLHGSAAALPLPTHSVDAVVCLYSLHHVVGNSVRENEAAVGAVVRELARVLRPGGDLLIFEVAPWWPIWQVQCLGWDIGRRLCGRSLDMFFWERGALRRLAQGLLPPGSEFAYHAFRVPPWTTFPPVFALQRVRLPRWLYPFHICLYHWRIG
jgi:SAM-dependent methyltransferase